MGGGELGVGFGVGGVKFNVKAPGADSAIFLRCRIAEAIRERILLLSPVLFEASYVTACVFLLYS